MEEQIQLYTSRQERKKETNLERLKHRNPEMHYSFYNENASQSGMKMHHLEIICSQKQTTH